MDMGSCCKAVAGYSGTYLQSQLLEMWRQKDHLLTMSLDKGKETLSQKQNQNKSFGSGSCGTDLE
jgi:hypothetical protein